METDEFSKIMHDIEVTARYKSIVRNPKVLFEYTILNLLLYVNFIILLYLFYGPTGTGKSRLMKKISNELKRPFIEISGSDIYNKWTGKSEKNAELVNIYKILQKSGVKKN